MKKTLLIGLIALGATTAAEAGGLLNTTNLHALYLRSLSRNATLSIDGAYYNPAGLVFAKDGWRFSINSQTIFQERNIDANFKPFAFSAGSADKTFKGKATAPIFPTAMLAYKQGDWAFSAVAGIFGGGGKASFANGLPQFEGAVAMIPATTRAIKDQVTPLMGGLSNLPTTVSLPIQKAVGALTGVNRYGVNSQLDGLQYNIGLQLGATYKINDHFSAYLGGRLLYAYNSYEGHIGGIQVNNAADGTMAPAPIYFGAIDKGITALKSQLGSLPEQVRPQIQAAFASEKVQSLLAVPGKMAQATTDKQIEVKQTGWGFAPIVGVNFKYDKLNLAARYEFRTSIDVKNDTKVNTSGLAQFDDNVKNPNDLPAVLAVGASYQFLPSFTASVSYNHFFEKSARMVGDKQKTLDHNTNEYMLGLEWKALKWLDVSGGIQLTDKGVTDAYQSDLHFDMGSTSYGLGVGIHLNDAMMLNLGYMITDYKTHTKVDPKFYFNEKTNISVEGTEIFKRKSQVFAIGIDYTL